MKKTILFIFLFSFLLSENVKANPIIPPPVISELYFNNKDWTLELVFGNYPPIVVDSLVIITSTDTVGFKHNFHIKLNVPLLITKDSLLRPLFINKKGDFVTIALRMGHGFFQNLDNYTKMAFGNIANAQVTAPLPGQSVKRVAVYNNCSAYPGYGYYIVKDSHPTLGTDPFKAVGNSSLSGYVYFPNLSPVPNDSIYGNGVLVNCPAWYNPIRTNDSGYFVFQNNVPNNGCSYSYIRHLTIQNQYCKKIDTTFSVEPDSAYVMKFIFDSCNTVSVHNLGAITNFSLQIFPNPGSKNFTFIIEAPWITHSTNVLKIYNMDGELVNLIPIENTSSDHVVIPWNGKGRYADLPAGIYTCSLETDGHTSVSQKLVIQK